jgi:hypothetical protein
MFYFYLVVDMQMIYLITLANGSRLKVKENEVFNTFRGDVEARDLRAGDHVITFDEITGIIILKVEYVGWQLVDKIA